MTILLNKLNIQQPSTDDLVLVIMRHSKTGGMGWAAVHGERILAWDGWYEENRKLRTLGDLNQMYSDVEKIATEQLGSALWCAELAGETNSILSTVRYQMMLNDNRGPDNEEVFELRRAGVVSYMILGPASDLLPYLQKQPV